MSGGTLTGEQRRLVTGIVVVASAFTMVSAAYNYILQPMLDSFDASESQTSMVRQLPSIATLLVVFIGGALGDRFGDRRTLLLAGWLFTAGSLLVGVAPVFGLATAGLVIQGAAVSVGGVVSLGFLSARISEPASRASAFSVFAIVSPFVYLVIPVIAGALVDRQTWRLVPALWCLGGLAALWACWRLLPHDGPPRRSGEFATPLLAGIALSSVVLLINAASDDGSTSQDVIIRATIALVALILLVVLHHRLQSPTLSFAALREGGMLVLMIVVLLVPFVNLWFYATMGFQYVYGLTTLQTALAMVPVQLGAVVGAMITRKILQRKGVPFTGTVLLIAFAASMVPIMMLTVDAEVWVPILVFFTYAAAFTGAGIPITNAIMNTAPPGHEGSASAFRSAASHIGMSLGVVFTTVIITTVMTNSLNSQLSSQGLRDDQSKEIVMGIVDGSTSEDLSAQYSVPVSDVDTISGDVAQSMIHGMRAVAKSGCIIALLCAATFTAATRRQTAARARATAAV